MWVEEGRRIEELKTTVSSGRRGRELKEERQAASVLVKARQGTASVVVGDLLCLSSSLAGWTRPGPRAHPSLCPATDDPPDSVVLSGNHPCAHRPS